MQRKKIYKSEMFDWVPISPGKFTVIPAYSAYGTKLNPGATWTYTGKEPEHEVKDFLERHNLLGTFGVRYPTEVFQQPKITGSKIAKHFRLVRPGEIDLLCPDVPEVLLHASGLGRNELFVQPPTYVIYLGKEKRMMDNPGFDSSTWNCEMTFLNFLAGDKKLSMCDHHYMVSAVNNYYVRGGACLFESWVYHRENLYVTKNRKICK